MFIYRKRRFGLIGSPLGHSLSPQIHRRIMEGAGIVGDYRLYEVSPQDLAAVLPLLLKELDGFNCTIPHKQAVIPYLAALAPSARLYGAVNTVARGIGHNTDGAGFASCNVPMRGRRVTILGAGGVARVLATAAAEANAASITVAARNTKQATTLAKDLQGLGYSAVQAVGPATGSAWDVLLNGTPLGMWPKTSGLAATALRGERVFDTVYNPTATRLVLQAKSRGIASEGGLAMLVEQALAAQAIWNPQADFTRSRAQLSQMRSELAREILRRCPLKLLLTGFMGSGKTSVGQGISRAMAGDLPFVDLDAFIAQRQGEDIAAIFARRGQAAFRRLEQNCLAELLASPGSALIATGGGALVQAGAKELIAGANALVIYLDVAFATAMQRLGQDRSRPLLAQGPAALRQLYELRRPLYTAVADLTVAAAKPADQVAKTIMAAFEWLQITQETEG